MPHPNPNHDLKKPWEGLRWYNECPKNRDNPLLSDQCRLGWFAHRAAQYSTRPIWRAGTWQPDADRLLTELPSLRVSTEIWAGSARTRPAVVR